MDLVSLDSLWTIERSNSKHDEHKPAKETLKMHPVIIILSQNPEVYLSRPSVSWSAG